QMTTGVIGFLQSILDEGALEREEREVIEAQTRLREAQGSLETLRQQGRSIEHRLAQLEPARLEAELAAARAARAEALVRSGSSEGQRLQDLAIQIESIDIELVPLLDAVPAGEAAFGAVSHLLAALDAAAARRGELVEDHAKALAGEAQAKLVVFGRALGEVGTAAFVDPLVVEPRDLTFADTWVKALFGRGDRQARIAAARAQMVARVERIGALLGPVRARHDELSQRRAALVSERDQI
ncbi:MAG TPA: hypothetical protein VK427_05210, partial [Kofleriaceae bacterium]|nr:hypothetical protein [Kofleriaceae bacterium]